MRIVVFHSNDTASDADSTLLRKAMSEEVIRVVLFAALGVGKRDKGSRALIPSDWKATCAPGRVEQYDCELSVGPPRGTPVSGDWLTISDGRYFTGIDPLSVLGRLSGQASDVVAISVNPRFERGSDLARFASDGAVAGFRRFYDDGISPGPFPRGWPHHLAINAALLDKLACDGAIPANFGVFLSQCRANNLAIRSIQVGGRFLDLARERGLAELLTRQINGNYYLKKEHLAGSVKDARVVGNVVMGEDVVLSEGALVIGPSIICNRARIGSAAIVRGSVLGENVSVEPGSVVRHRVLLEPDNVNGPACQAGRSDRLSVSLSIPAERKAQFRMWPKFSYAVVGKRIADIVSSIAALALLAPVFPIVAAAIKLTSSGPVFFRHKREGLHGREFGCLKFRTMIVGSDDIQQKLRSLNQVDGPQFKMEEDPRITQVGRFLRGTFIDEIPQFINILRGDMSIVGPRPSPRSENVMCAPWRDCRLSVKPGVTGLWQVSRTRQRGRDFQEWIHYDTLYVRNLSFGLDLRLVWKTIVKLARDFVNQF